MIVSDEQEKDRYASAKSEWNALWMQPLAAKRNWQIMAVLLTVALIVSIAGNVYLGRLPKQVAYVVERDGGSVRYAGQLQPIDMSDSVLNSVKLNTLTRFLESWRLVTSDVAAQKANWDRAYTFVSQNSQAKKALDAWYEKNNPLAKIGSGQSVAFMFRTFDIESPTTYGLFWDETTYGVIDGREISHKRWRARVTFAITPPQNETVRAANPLGILCTELTWQEVQQ